MLALAFELSKMLLNLEDGILLHSQEGGHGACATNHDCVGCRGRVEFSGALCGAQIIPCGVVCLSVCLCKIEIDR